MPSFRRAHFQDARFGLESSIEWSHWICKVNVFVNVFRKYTYYQGQYPFLFSRIYLWIQFLAMYAVGWLFISPQFSQSFHTDLQEYTTQIATILVLTGIIFTFVSHRNFPFWVRTLFNFVTLQYIAIQASPVFGFVMLATIFFFITKYTISLINGDGIHEPPPWTKTHHELLQQPRWTQYWYHLIDTNSGLPTMLHTINHDPE